MTFRPEPAPAPISAQVAQPSRTTSELQAAAYLLRHDPAGNAQAELERLYAALRDPATGEPDPRGAAAGLRDALNALRDASRADLKNTGLHGLLGLYLLANGLNGSAVSELQIAAAQREDADKLAVPLAFALLRAGRLEELLALAIATPPSQRALAMLRVIRARAMEAMGHYDDATAMLRLALEADPASIDAIVRAGLLDLWHGDRSAAKHWLEQAERIAPNAVATLRLRGEYFYAVGDFTASASAYGMLVAMRAPESYDPTPPSLGLARAQIYQGDLQAAAVTLGRADLAANDAMVGYYRALSAYRSGAFQRASELAEPLVGALRDYPAVYLLLGGAMLANGYPETAHHYLEHYVNVVPANGVARTLFGEAVRQLKEPGVNRPVASWPLYAALGFAVAKAEAGQTSAAP